MKLRFNSGNGRRPQTEAKRYAYGVLVAMLDAQLSHRPECEEGWMFGGIEHEPDRRRLTKAIRQLMVKFQREADR